MTDSPERGLSRGKRQMQLALPIKQQKETEETILEYDLDESQGSDDLEIDKPATKYEDPKQEFENLWKNVTKKEKKKQHQQPLTSNKLGKWKTIGNLPLPTNTNRSRAESSITDKGAVMVAIRRVQSESFMHTWDYHGFFWDPEKWKDKSKKKKKPKKSVRFHEDVVDRNAIVPEMDMQTFGDILFNERRQLHQQLIAQGKLPSKELDLSRIGGEVDATKTINAVYETIEGKKLIVAATMEKLVSSLADGEVPDLEFVKDWLLSYRLIMGPLRLLNLLIERHSFTPPKGATSDDLEFHKIYSPVVKLRVMNVLKKWLQSHYYDFSTEPRVFHSLQKFVEELPVDDKWGLQLRVIMQEKNPEDIPFSVDKNTPMEIIAVTMKRKDCGFTIKKYVVEKEYYNACFTADDFLHWVQAVLFLSLDESTQYGEKMMKSGLIFPLNPNIRDFSAGELYRFANFPETQPPEVLAPKFGNNSEPPKFLDINPLELARQMTLVSRQLFEAINSKELTMFEKNSWMKSSPGSAPALFSLTSYESSVTNWVASEIVVYVNTSQRVEVLRRFIQIAENCRKFQNFSDMMAVAKGLFHPSIQRLKKTWKGIGRKYQKLRSVVEKLYTDQKTRRQEMAIAAKKSSSNSLYG